MSNGTAGTVATTLSQILASLTPGQLAGLGRHLTQSGEIQALQILNAMEANPTIAATMLPALTGIPNLPAEVITWVTAALQPNQPAGAFQQNMAQAISAVQRAATSSGILGNLGL